LDTSAEDTGLLCLFIDKLFDSVNGSTILPPAGKNLRCAVTKTSAHWNFWNEALRTLETMTFDCKHNKVVSIKNWIETIKGVKYLSKKLLKNGFDFVLLRNFNQDPIKNFFCCIRSHGLRNINPSCCSFISSFKSLLISNLTTSNSVGSNCEKDDCYGVLDSLKDLLELDDHEITDTEDNVFQKNQSSSISTKLMPFNNTIPIISTSEIQKNTRSYVTGWIIKKIKPLLNNCKICLYKLTSDVFLNEHNFINSYEYEKCNLNYPKTETSNLYGIIIHLFNLHISDVIDMSNVKKEIILILKKFINTEALTCPKHDLVDIFLNTSVQVLLFSFIKEINSILKIGERKQINTNNNIKIAALKYNKT